MNVTDAHGKLKAGIRALTSSDDWKRALAFASRFHHYSFGNTLLIGLQCPDATRVAGFKTWLKLGRHVRAGEKGIAILAPRIRKIWQEDEESGEKTLIGAHLSGFKAVFVFDVSQTEGQPLPADPTIFVQRLQGGADHERTLFRLLCAALGRQGWDAGRSATFDRQPDSLNGYTDYIERCVHIRPELSDAQALKTLMHEYAHVVLHTPIKALDNRPLCETEAESAAFIAAAVTGLDTSSYSFGYVASWSGGDEQVIEAAGRHAQDAAREILTALGVSEEEEAA